MHQPSADQKRGDYLELSTQVHQEVHRELEPKDSHVELEHAVDARVVGLVPRVVATGRLDDADAELPYDLDARSGAPIHGTLHERNEDELGDEERERRARHPKVDMDHVGQHGKHHSLNAKGNFCLRLSWSSRRLVRGHDCPMVQLEGEWSAG